jgi:hypothetical protein
MSKLKGETRKISDKLAYFVIRALLHVSRDGKARVWNLKGPDTKPACLYLCHDAGIVFVHADLSIHKFVF